MSRMDDVIDFHKFEPQQFGPPRGLVKLFLAQNGSKAHWRRMERKNAVTISYKPQ